MALHEKEFAIESDNPSSSPQDPHCVRNVPTSNLCKLPSDFHIHTVACMSLLLATHTHTQCLIYFNSSSYNLSKQAKVFLTLVPCPSLFLLGERLKEATVGLQGRHGMTSASPKPHVPQAHSIFSTKVPVKCNSDPTVHSQGQYKGAP